LEYHFSTPTGSYAIDLDCATVLYRRVARFRQLKMKTNNVLLNDSNAFIGDEVAAVENPLNKEENVSGETPLIEYENSIGEKCCGACSIHTKFSVTNKV